MSKQRQKGTQAETEVVKALHRAGFSEALRAPLWGAHDRGDIVGIPAVISVKNQKTMKLAEWVDDCDQMIVNAGTDTGFVWHKRIGRGRAEDWYVTMKAEMMLELLKRLR
jgi:hypothetical protein